MTTTPQSEALGAGPAPRLAPTLAITAIAGYLDAIGYVQLNHLFVSFMSGNSTHLGMALATENWRGAAVALGIIGAFCLGAFLGTLATDLAGPNALAALFGIEFGIILLACGLGLAAHEVAALVAVTIAMGLQNMGHQAVASADIGRGYITGALFGFASALAGMVRGKATLATATTYLASWTSFVAGVIAGSLAFAALGLVPAIALTAAPVGLLAVGFTVFRQVRR